MRLITKKKSFFRYFVLIALVGHGLYYHARYVANAHAVLSYGTYPFLVSYRFVFDRYRYVSNLFREKEKLLEDLKKLTEDNDILHAENCALKGTVLYAYQTAELVAFKKRYELSGAFLAHVLTITLNEHEQTMLISGGTREGITKNMIALSNNGLVGKVIEVYAWYCKIQLVTDARCKISICSAESGAFGIYHGNNSNEPLVDHVSHLDQLHEGELLLSSGKGLIFPRGFVVGTVTTVHKKNLHYQVIVKPSVDISNLAFCLLTSKAACEKQI